MSEISLFEVKKIPEMKNLVRRINDRVTEMKGVQEKVKNSLANLQENIGGSDDIGTALSSLSYAIETNSSNVNSHLLRSANSINLAMLKYDEAELNAEKDLRNVSE